jgi:DNA-binding HxlR family transcriptional regulator
MPRSVPKPGKPVRGSKTGRPIMALFELLGRRWALRIIWELRDGSLRFRALREKCGGVSPTILNQRLRELREAAIVTLEDEGYSLTEQGWDLFAALAPLSRWAERWKERMED